MSSRMELIILSPTGGARRIPCGAVNLTAMDNEAGEGGGSVGIRPGHMEALIALEPGSFVTAVRPGEEPVELKLPGGFAHVKNNAVTVLLTAEEENNGTDI